MYYEVKHNSDGWTVKNSKSTVSKVFPTKTASVNYASKIAKKSNSILLTRKLDGEIDRIRDYRKSLISNKISGKKELGKKKIISAIMATMAS